MVVLHRDSARGKTSTNILNGNLKIILITIEKVDFARPVHYSENSVRNSAYVCHSIRPMRSEPDETG